ncbi:hypothetical protein [Roseivivax sp. THAF40]|uniref:hypothetical protein n=1 Tax=Roseivivax sp. THAF40 TaxID=2587858 RepID=UPI0015625EEC|nr:hypothetical protein [Roseivivax sp. THAF40]
MALNKAAIQSMRSESRLSALYADCLRGRGENRVGAANGGNIRTDDFRLPNMLYDARMAGSTGRTAASSATGERRLRAVRVFPPGTKKGGEPSFAAPGSNVRKTDVDHTDDKQNIRWRAQCSD